MGTATMTYPGDDTTTGLKKTGVRGVYRLVFINSIINAEADLETAYELDETELYVLMHADTIFLTVTLGAETGSATFDVEKLQYSRDGTNFVTWEDLTDTTLAAEGDWSVVLTKKLPLAAQIKLLVDTATLSGSAYFARSQVALDIILNNASEPRS
jgi:hypothetical protein